MKKITLLFSLVSLALLTFGQRWELFKKDLSHYIEPTPFTVFGNSIYTDSLAFTVKVAGVANYSSKKVTVFEDDFNDLPYSTFSRFCAVKGPSILGDSMVEYMDSTIYYSGTHQFIWKNAQQWTFYTSLNNENLIITLDSAYSLNGDSIKIFSFSAVNQSAFDSVLFSTPFVVSKSNGMIKGFNFSDFPTSVNLVTYFHSNAITTSDIYDLDIGDEYHYQIHQGLHVSFITTDLYINKVIGKQVHGQDSVTYTFEQQVTDDQLVVVNNNPFPTHQYTHFQDTVQETYSLNDTLLSGRYLDGNSTPINPLMTLGSIGIFTDGYDLPTFVDFSGVGRVADTICDYTFELETYKTYVFGVGMFYHYDNGDITSYNLHSEQLVYYRKGSKIWGTPLSIPVGLAERALSNLEYYPNPANDYFYINHLQSDCNYELINVNGALIGRGVFVAGSNTLSLQSLEKGMYFLELRTAGELKTIKLIKQ